MGYHRVQKQKHKDRKLYKLSKNWYCRGLWYNSKTNHLCRAYPYKRNGCNAAKYYRKISNRRIRQDKDHKYDYGAYKKKYDIWWMLF